VPLSSQDLKAPLGLQLFFLTSVIISTGSWVAILTGVIITSFFIPNMLRKGTIDLLLAKPISRWMLLLYKYVGGLSFIFFNNLVAVGGIWLVLGWRSGIWANWFLLLVPVLTFFFAILYAVSTLFGVMTRSTVAAILITCGAWFFFFLVGTAYQVFESGERKEEKQRVPPDKQQFTNNTFGRAVKLVHTVTPRTSDLSYLGSVLIMSDFLTGDPAMSAKLSSSKMNWKESLLVSGIFIFVMLSLACWWFATKDY
jgi:ABC-type transport system involved in multi-copper enzyme maturation permease subunit